MLQNCVETCGRNLANIAAGIGSLKVGLQSGTAFASRRRLAIACLMPHLLVAASHVGVDVGRCPAAKQELGHLS